MTRLPYTLEPSVDDLAPMGLIVLQVDETIEPEFKHHFADTPNPLYVTRIPSGAEVTEDTLAAMEEDLATAASLLPQARPYPVIGYACTSASSVIGSSKVEALVQSVCDVATVTNPLRAAVHVAGDLGVSRFALLSPYVGKVNATLRAAFADQGITTDVFGSFGEAEEAQAVRISTQSIVDAAVQLGRDPQVEAVFLSCTNLRTLKALPEIRARIGKPVLSSNSVLAAHMKQLVCLSEGQN